MEMKKSYTYSGREQHLEPWNPTLKLIKSNIENIAQVSFKIDAFGTFGVL
jgi:hypothetical protein